MSGLSTLSLVDLKNSTTTAGRFRLGEVAGVFDVTYGPMKATYVLAHGAVGVAGSPMFEAPGLGDWYADDDENGSVVGQEFCVGAWLGGVTTVGSTYGWVLTAGKNPIDLVSDGSIAAGYSIVPSETDGAWSGFVQTIYASDSGLIWYGRGALVATAHTADDSTGTGLLAAGDAMFHSVWADLPQTV